jgi:hypothetical protein
MINFFTYQQNGQTTGVTSMILKPGAGSHINADTISSYTMFYLWWATGDVLTGYAKNKIHVIYLHLPLLPRTSTVAAVAW